MRQIEILTLEVGSTITKANGFVRRAGGGFDHVAQGFAPTSVAEGDVGIGVDAALADPLELSGAARDQVDRVAAAVDALAARYPEAAAYVPGVVL